MTYYTVINVSLLQQLLTLPIRHCTVNKILTLHDTQHHKRCVYTKSYIV